MPSYRSEGSFADHTYQSRYGESGEEQAARNQGCSSDVWLSTRSIITRMPRFSAWCSSSAKSPMVPRRGSTP
jgi:hypothetical protein